MEDHEIYSAIGEDGFTRLIAAFYRHVPQDDILGPMYAGDFEGAEERLRSFLIYRFGGPQHYIEKRGHPRLRMRHAPFPVDGRARGRWLRLMNTALDEAHLPKEVRKTLWDFFDATARFLTNRPDVTSIEN